MEQKDRPVPATAVRAFGQEPRCARGTRAGGNRRSDGSATTGGPHHAPSPRARLEPSANRSLAALCSPEPRFVGSASGDIRSFGARDAVSRTRRSLFCARNGRDKTRTRAGDRSLTCPRGPAPSRTRRAGRGARHGGRVDCATGRYVVAVSSRLGCSARSPTTSGGTALRSATEADGGGLVGWGYCLRGSELAAPFRTGEPPHGGLGRSPGRKISMGVLPWDMGLPGCHVPFHRRCGRLVTPSARPRLLSVGRAGTRPLRGSRPPAPRLLEVAGRRRVSRAPPRWRAGRPVPLTGGAFS